MERILEGLEHLARGQDRNTRMLESIHHRLKRVDRTEQQMTQTLDALLSAVNEENTVIDSMEALVDNLTKLYTEANTANDPAIKAVTDQILAKKAEILAKTIANTPVANTPDEVSALADVKSKPAPAPSPAMSASTPFTGDMTPNQQDKVSAERLARATAAAKKPL